MIASICSFFVDKNFKNEENINIFAMLFKLNAIRLEI